MQHYHVRRPTAARPPPHHQAGFNFLDSIQVHLTQTGLPFKKGVLKVFAQYKKGSNKMSTNFEESIEDLDRCEL
ncbi:hypothetical protein CMV_011550 [Castanea mollissima]|uniref:Uncharacterized protein n=1 Tax=Castanea mollissima TaxID=60419 RepID=A0A8J4RGF9_9ROSI|nr:hypothetical protein CMV_011550 [Castanea mollissima]